MENLIKILLALVPAVVLHEYAHGWVAYKLGDPTAKLSGRLTLNPIKHIDPVGTIVIPLVLFLMRAPILAWAKPVPVNFFNLKNPKRDMLWVGMAGPIINVVLAWLLSLSLDWPLPFFMKEVIALSVVINLVLAVFNMTPIPPLDGSRLVMSLLPMKYARPYARLEPYGIIIVIVLLSLGLLNQVIWPIIIFLTRVFGVEEWLRLLLLG